MARNRIEKPSRAQSKISFTPKTRRSTASEEIAATKLTELNKQGLIVDQPRLRQRKEKEVAKEIEDSEIKTLSQQNIDEIINGEESQNLLNSFYTERIRTPRYHQDDLSVGDKVLRFFDLSTVYGPAQGLTRLERWNRAHRLGKQPPHQVKTILQAAQQTNEYSGRYEMSLFGKLG